MNDTVRAFVVDVGRSMRELRETSSPPVEGQEVASRLGITPGAVSRWETASMTGSPALHNVADYAASLGYALELRFRRGAANTVRVERDNDTMLASAVDRLRAVWAMLDEQQRAALLMYLDFLAQRAGEQPVKARSGKG